jgi:soluble lytic murein transglycosylase-like protein
MKSITQSNRFFPNTCGVVSTTHGALCSYLHAIIMKLYFLGHGTFFEEKCIRVFRKELCNNVFFKTGAPLFAQSIDLQQAVKYGAVLYIVATMLFLPSGICSRQSGPAHYHDWVIDQPAPSPYAPAVGMPAGENAPVSEKAEAKNSTAGEEEAATPGLPFESHILQAARTYQVDPALIGAIIMAESNYNPKAVSHRGAQGLMQLMPTTAKWLGIEDSFDPALNIDGGVRYFKRLLDRFDGNVKLALAAYNAGSRYVRKYGGVPPFKATRRYIKKVLHYHRILQDQFAASGNDLTAS